MKKRHDYRGFAVLFFILLLNYQIQCLGNENKTKEVDKESSDNKANYFSRFSNFFDFFKNEQINLYYEGFKVLIDDIYFFCFTDWKATYKKQALKKMNIEKRVFQNIQKEQTNNHINRKLQIQNNTQIVNDIAPKENYTSSCKYGKYILINKTPPSNDLIMADETNITLINKTASSTIPLCICPVTSRDCFSITNDVVCRFKQLLANNIDLLVNKDSFYFEYFNRNYLKYENKSFEFKAKLKCHNRYPTNTTQNYILEDKSIDNYTILNQTDQLINLNKPLEYYIEDENITIYEQPDLFISFNFYDMKSVIPKIKYTIPVDESILKEALRGNQEIIWTIDLDNINKTEVYCKDEPKNLLTGGRLFYELKLFESKTGSVTCLFHQGSIDYANNSLYHMKINESWINLKIISGFAILLLILITIMSLYYIYVFRKRFINRINDQNVREIMLKET